MKERGFQPPLDSPRHCNFLRERVAFCFVQLHSSAFNRFVMRECWFGVKNRCPRPGSVSVANNIRKQTRPGRGEILRPVGFLLRDVCKQKKRSRLFNLDHPWSIGDSNS